MAAIIKTIEDQGASAQEYRRLELKIRDKITGGEWAKGTKLPGRGKLAREFNVGIGTLERAIAPLVSEGLLVATDRSGTFVATDKPAEFEPIADDRQEVEVESTRKLGQITATLGIIGDNLDAPLSMPGSEDFWLRPLFRAMERRFALVGGRTQLFNRLTPGHPTMDDTAGISSLLEDGANALAVVFPDDDPSRIEEALSAMGGGHIPLVFVLDKPIDLPIPHVFYDQRAAGYQAAQHLDRLGYKKLLFLSPFDTEWIGHRLEGVCRYAKAARLPGNLLDVQVGEMSALDAVGHQVLGYRAACEAFAAGSIAGAGVIAGNDLVAFGILQAAAELGITPGADFGLVGFDDHLDSRAKGLTSLRAPMAAIGEQAADQLLRALRGEDMSMQIRMSSRLMPRSSTFSQSKARA